MNQTTTNPANLRQLADQIRQHILSDVEDARLRELAAHIIEKYKVPERSPRQLARAFQLYSQNDIKFFREFPEVNAAPWITAKWRIGDCDDKARLIAALLKSFRIPVRLAFVTFTGPDGGTKSHVWPEYGDVNVDGQPTWFALESVRPWPLGKSPLDVIRAKGFRHNHFEVVI